METNEIPKGNRDAQKLKVLQAKGNYFVESTDGRVLYKVTQDGGGKYLCSCEDCWKGIKSDPNFQCEHILALIDCLSKKEAEGTGFQERKKPKLDERFIKTIDGKDFVLYSGLLDLAHQRGLLKIEVEPLQYPMKENGYFAICRATALSKSGETFSDIGDASPANCDAKFANHLLRMASTRAKSRVLRDLDNIGMTCLEELGELDEVLGNHPKKLQKGPLKKGSKSSLPPIPQGGKPEAKGPHRAGERSIKPRDGEPQNESKPHPQTLMSSAQKNAILNLGQRRGTSLEELTKMAQQNYGVSFESLSSEDASQFIRLLQQSPKSRSSHSKNSGEGNTNQRRITPISN